MDIFYSALLARFPFHFRLYMSSRAAPIFCSLLSTFILVTDEGSKLEILGLLAAISTLLLGYIHANESIALALNRSSTPSQLHKSVRRISLHIQNLFSTSENMRSRRRDLTSPPSVRFTAENTYSIIQRSEYA